MKELEKMEDNSLPMINLDEIASKACHSTNDKAVGQDEPEQGGNGEKFK